MENICTLEEIFEAYNDCVKNKVNSIGAIDFYINKDLKLAKLCREINDGTYEIGTSNVFVVKYPVYREVFAADFRDRIVHHYLINKLIDLFEEQFISTSFSCRKGKGVLYGVKETQKLMQECVLKYNDCYILKMDIKSFFMSIDKKLLNSMVYDFILKKYKNNKDKKLLMDLSNKIVMHRPELNCKFHCDKSLWDNIPYDKSLFNVGETKGLPIGNLTSQIFANLYLDSFDHFIIEDLGFKYYVRYVDDFIIMFHDKKQLLSCISKLETFLNDKLLLKLHPKKRYIQHYTKGVKFIGSMIYVDRIYTCNRSIKTFKYKLEKFQYIEKNEENARELLKIINSYLGFFIHNKTYKIRKEILESNLIKIWNEFLYPSQDYTKVILRKINL